MVDRDSVDMVMEQAVMQKCEEMSAKVVNIELNNCTGCTFNWS